MNNVFYSAYIVMLMMALASTEVSSRDGRSVWDSRCEECHGNPDRFARKYLWNIAGQLQGQHHISDLGLFMRNHYIPNHEIDTVRKMLFALANSSSRYTKECSECHGDLDGYVGKHFWVGASGITIIETGNDVGEFLQNHRELKSEDVSFYLQLFSRIAGSPLPLSDEPVLPRQ